MSTPIAIATASPTNAPSTVTAPVLRNAACNSRAVSTPSRTTAKNASSKSPHPAPSASARSTPRWSSPLIKRDWRIIQNTIQVRTTVARSIVDPSKTCSVVPSNSAPTASSATSTATPGPPFREITHRLEREDLVRLNGRKEIALTDAGGSLAAQIVRRHRLIERMLTDLLGYEWWATHEEAERLEHAISPEMERRLIERLGDPETCPHGNPMPGRPHDPRAHPLP